MVGIAEVAFRAVAGIQAEGLTGGAGVIAHVRGAILSHAAHARAGAIADPGEVKGGPFAVGRLAEEAVGPVCARTRTVTLTVEAAGRHIRSRTLWLGVETGCGVDAVAHTVADSALPTLVVGVGAVGHLKATALLTRVVARFTFPATCRAATHAVGAERRNALARIIARFAHVLLRDATPGIAIVSTSTMVVLGAIAATVFSGIVADIGIAWGRPGINAGTGTVTTVGQMEGVADTDLGQADDSRQVDPAVSGAVAGAIVIATWRAVVGTVITGVGAVGGKGAGTGPVTPLAEGTLVVRVLARADGWALAQETIHCTRLAQPVARRIAAIPVHTLVGKALVVSLAGGPVVLLGLTEVRGVAEIAVNALRIVDTRPGTVGTQGVAQVGVTGFGPVINTGAGAIARIHLLEDPIGTTLGTADGASGPEAACPGAVAATITATGYLQRLNALVVGVGPRQCIATGAQTVAAFTEAALAFGVRGPGIGRTGAPEARQTARLTLTVARAIAAVAVHAITRTALIIGGAGFAIGLAFHALVALAPGARNTLSVGDTTGEAAPISVTDVRITLGGPIVDTGPQPVAGIRIGLDTVRTGLGNAGRARRVKVASATAIAGAVEPTGGNVRQETIVQGVLTGGNILAGANAIADLAGATIIFGVAVCNVEGA
jgi:hypothetical protein